MLWMPWGAPPARLAFEDPSTDQQREARACLIDQRREPQNNQEVFTGECGGTIWPERLKPGGVLLSATAGKKTQIKVAEGDGAGNLGMQATMFVETAGRQEERELLRLEMPF